MRVLKFRGIKTGNQGFRYGHYHKLGEQHFIRNDSVLSSVYSDTICQYTGLKDKNGKEIYEGDIVSFKEDIFGLHYIERTGDVYRSDKGSYLINYQERYFELFDYILSAEIIGNIYENPELLKGE